MSSLSWIEQNVTSLKDQGLYNHIKTIDSPIGAHITIDGKDYLNFCSNNYLGLANHPELIAAAKAALDQYGVGPAAVRSIAGTTSLHTKLESDLAQFKKAEAVLTYQSGFMANLAVIPALVGKDDIIFSDELNHASIIDGCRLSKATIVPFKHADPADLKEKIAANSGFPKKLIVTDGVFSMDGDIAPLPELVVIAKETNSILMVDDAHGEGVLGDGGRGIVDHFQLHGQVDVEVGTLSKAFGVVGGLVAGSQLLIDWLKQRSRPFLFSSAMTIPDVAACIAAVQLLSQSTSLVEKLWHNADYLKTKLKEAGFDIGSSKTPIIPLMLGDEKLAQQFSAKLFDHGLFAKAIVYPTVALGKARIRLMVSAAHTQEDLDQAVDLIKKLR